MKKELDELKGVLNVINRLNDTSYITEGVKEELKKNLRDGYDNPPFELPMHLEDVYKVKIETIEDGASLLSLMLQPLKEVALFILH